MLIGVCNQTAINVEALHLIAELAVQSMLEFTSNQ